MANSFDNIQGHFLPSFSELTSSIADYPHGGTPRQAAVSASSPGRYQYQAQLTYAAEHPGYHATPAIPMRPAAGAPLGGVLALPPAYCYPVPGRANTAVADQWPRHLAPMDTPVQQQQSNNMAGPAMMAERMPGEDPNDFVHLPASLKYTETLDAIAKSAKALFNFARQYSADAKSRQQQGGSGGGDVLVRIPARRELNVMSNDGDVIRQKLEDLHKIRKCAEEIARGKRPIPPATLTVSSSTARGSGKSDRKGRKRTRGVEVDGQGKKTIPARNAEGRCYQCNMEESTEWRRGPDGPKTLCNKCGLQYSKKERELKELREQRKLRERR